MNIDISYIQFVNYALVHAGIEICEYCEIQNGGEELHDVLLECSGEYLQTFQSPVMPLIEPGKTTRLSSFDIKPDAAKIAMLTSPLDSSFCITAYCNATNPETRREIVRKEFPIHVLAFDRWLGTQILPQTLAAFVTPAVPAISQLIVRAAEFLKQMTGSSAFTAYQSGDSNDVVNQMAAVFAAIHSMGIIYTESMPSYEAPGQRIRLPEQVLSQKIGNCIELSLLYASALEMIGINSGIVLCKGHAYLAVWLVNDCYANGICDDASFLEKKCAKGIDEMLVLESTMLTQEAASFLGAEEAARKHLADHSTFEMLIDIHRCRLEHFLPLPLTYGDAGCAIDIENKGVMHDECHLELRQRSRYDLENIATASLGKMDIWERKLLDFSLRNTMLNITLRSKAVQFISFDVDKLEDTLQDGAEYQLLPKPEVKITREEGEKLVRSRLHPELQEMMREDIEHHKLHTYITEAETATTLKNIYRSTRTAIEETGANPLYLTIGALRWFVNDSAKEARYAPILMLPVQMVYKNGGYYIRTNEEDIMLNVTLMEFIRQNYGVEVPYLNNLPKDEHGVDVQLVFTMLRDALKEKKRWDVEEECMLGIFSFSKYLMWNDIHNHREEMMSNNVVASLVKQGLAWQPTPLAETLRQADREMAPHELALPVPADSSQMAAVLEAGKGNSFILYGPPGTGKSQTITNLIANALYQGKRVLFVAEKMAALSVVQNRLEKIGLGPFCLEMHGNKITKRHVLEQLGKALSVTHIASPEEYSATAQRLFEERKLLIEYMEALHNGNGRFSLYDLIIRHERIKGEAMTGQLLNNVLREKFVPAAENDYEHFTGPRLGNVLSLIGQPSQHPLLGMYITEQDLASPSGVTDSINRAIDVITRSGRDYAKLSETQTLRQQLLRDNSDALLNVDANTLRTEWRSIKAKWFLPRFFAKKDFMDRMRTYNKYLQDNEVDGLIDRLTDYQERHAAILTLQEQLYKHFGRQYAVDEVCTQAELSMMCQRLTQWAANIDKSRDWFHWCQYRMEAHHMGVDALIYALESRPMSATEAHDTFMKGVYRTLAQEKIMLSPALRTFEGMMFDDTVTLYKELTEDFRILSQKELYARLAAQIPRVTDSIDNSSEIGLLNRNISNGGRGLSLRDLFEKVPTLMPRLCPCMLMSPMSVAQFLDIKQEKFDLVVFDEASQMPTSEAVGAIARGKAVVVVGDPKQMPPTSFFTSTNVSDDEADIDDMESILDDCRALEIPSLQLSWHYRSQHESLIAFSNNEYYDGTLVTFPSVDDQQTKVRYVAVNGIYDKGGKRNNRAEAEAIVAEIRKRLADPSQAGRSIGVIAFSVVQQNLIEDLLQDLLDSDKSLHEAADALYEPIFVKNLENVQGDERDVILFSIGYGPDKDGKVSMNFGPLNLSGGERRLNVAVSRARQEMMVFSSLRSQQIDMRRSSARGVAGLKHFLEYAEQQILTHSDNASQQTDAVVAQSIAARLREAGYITQIGVGRSQFKVDIAVSTKEQPDIYVLGILLDGEGYRNTQTTRDREIVQPSVLGALRWQTMRVWSVDWFNNPDRVITRIIEKLQSAPETPAAAPAQQQTFDISQEKVLEVEKAAQPYKEFAATATAARMGNERLAAAIIDTEQPLTLMMLCRRVCAVKNIARVTPPMQNEFAEIVRNRFYMEPDRDGFVVWKDAATRQSYTAYRPASGRDISDIPLQEVKNAILEATREQFAIHLDNLSLIAVKKLGFTRRGNKVDEAVKMAVTQLIQEQRIKVEEGKISLL